MATRAPSLPPKTAVELSSCPVLAMPPLAVGWRDAAAAALAGRSFRWEGFAGTEDTANHVVGALLMGVDLVKETAVLNAAYDDAAGVTAAFNLNMLQHINRLIGADFDTGQWRHLAFFNEAQSRIEMHLEAMADFDVHWPGGGRRFDQGERIHTENSYKYPLRVFTDMLERAGFSQAQAWTDDRGWFAVVHARP